MQEKSQERIGEITLDLTHYPGEDRYCDGEVEDELLAIVSDYAPEQYGQIIEERKSWPLLYHLSPLRENIVEFLPIEKSHKVLEVGSGCGAVTGALAGKAGSVTCVDLSLKRSRINALRHSSCGNVTVHVGNFQDIEPDLPRDYDYICLIGAFEYGQGYIGGEDPFREFFRILQRHLAPGGRIVIAIENKYGLKYFAGCPEDHLGTFFGGIEDYKEGGVARTFSRKGLEGILQACGAEEYSFYYPYPDYKFMTALYSDKRLPQAGELCSNLRNYDRDRMLLFDEKSAFDGIIREGLFPVFSNSYLAVAGPELPLCYVRYSNDRAPQYRIKTEIVDREGEREVRKTALTGEAMAHVRGMERTARRLEECCRGKGFSVVPCRLDGEGRACFPYVEGETLSALLDGCLEKGDTEGFYRLFDRYVSLVKELGEKLTDYDLVFSNILVRGDAWTVIDYEWTLEEPLPAQRMIFRALHCYLLEGGRRRQTDPEKLLERAGITPQQAAAWSREEPAFQKKVTGERMSMEELWTRFGCGAVDRGELLGRYRQARLNDWVHVYYDRGGGFSEQDARRIWRVYTEENRLTARIPVDPDVRQVRVDPGDRRCLVTLEKVCLNGRTLESPDRFTVFNGIRAGEETYLLNNSDPNLVFSLPELVPGKENELTVSLEVVPLPRQTAENLMSKPGKEVGRCFLRNKKSKSS